MTYDNTNTGGLWQNRQKNTDRHPDLTGKAEVRCPHCGEVSEHRVAAWDKVSKAGVPWTSLAFSLPLEQEPAPQPAPTLTEGGRSDEFDDDLPF